LVWRSFFSLQCFTHRVVFATETPKQKIEEAFKKFTAREDIAVILIAQSVRAVGQFDCQAASVD
jgi:vacuolar-type H+-ATPase subunit F/Vma7